tara:strand:- start:1910 stop:2038 length:129 start_codon:yes stop_codon:yes gene_type:complete
MIYLTLLLFAVLLCMAHKRRRMEAQRWERIRNDAAKWEGGEG